MIKTLTKINGLQLGSIRKDDVYFEGDEFLVSAGYGDIWLIPTSINKIMITVDPIGCSSNVEFTCFPLSFVKANTAEWLPWDNGLVNTKTSSYGSPVTAIRQNKVGSTGNSRLEIKSIFVRI